LESPHSVFLFLFFFCFCLFFKFSKCMVTLLRNHLNFQNSFVLDKHQYDFCFFVLTLNVPKKYPWKHMRLCMVLEESKTSKDSSCYSFVSKSCAHGAGGGGGGGRTQLLATVEVPTMTVLTVSSPIFFCFFFFSSSFFKFVFCILKVLTKTRYFNIGFVFFLV